MTSVPQTRESLILRIADTQDAAAWEEFVAIYRPVLTRMAIARGLQHADADDLAQQVLVSVAGHVAGWESDSSRGRFRSWLAAMVRNAAINAMTRRRGDRAVGGTTVVNLINGKAAADVDDEELFDMEQKRELFRWATDQVRAEFQPATWDAFWLTAVEGLSGEAVATMTGKSVGAVYVARSRVMTRLQKCIQRVVGKEIQEARNDRKT